MERWGFLFSVMSSPIVYFLTTLLAVCPNINPTILCAHVCDVNYAACFCILLKNTNLINGILLKSVSYCYFYC